MKILKIFIFICTVCLLSTFPCFAKGLDVNNQSVQLLQSLTNEGKIIRQSDEPVEKADISADTVLVKDLKQQYYEANKRLLDVGKKKSKAKKIPE